MGVAVGAALGLPRIQRRLPLDDRPNQLHADDLDRFYLDYGASLIRWTDREEPAEEDATNLGYNRTEVRAGPFLQSGLVF